MQANEFIFNSIEMLNNIFQYFNYHEQIKLTRVCRAFHDVIVNYIWKRKYKELEVMRTPTNFILTNRIYSDSLDLEILKQTRIILSAHEFDEFLNLNANNVQILKFWLTRHLANKAKTHFNIKYKLLNLNSLTFVDEIITAKSFHMLSTFCPQLEKLCLEFCLNSEGQAVKLGKDIKVENIENIKTLKYLEVNDTTYNFLDEHHHRNSDIMEILLKLKLLQIILRVTIMPDECQNAFGLLLEDGKLIINPCKILKLGPFYNTNCFIKLKKKCLHHFQNLTNLTLVGNSRDTIDDNDFCGILSNSYARLKYLELDCFILTNFAWPQTITELVIHRCNGLTCKDLEYILSILKLKTFSTTETKYDGERMANDIRASKTLEYLKFDNPQIAQLFELSEYFGFQNISSLEFTQNANFMLKHISRQCPNLRKLKMTENGVSNDDFYKLKSLEKFEIECARHKDLSNLLLILKHSTLTHFVIQEFFQVDYDTSAMYDESLDFKTNLLLINIPINMFKHLQDFWLQLLNKNPQLHIMFLYHPTELTPSFLKPLITHPKFPHRLKTIKVFGFDIDCQHLRDEFDVTLCNIIRSDPYLDYPLEQFFIML